MPARAEEPPFVGRWDCEVAEFTFTATTYHNGSETMKIAKVTRDGTAYLLHFADGYRIGLDGVKRDKMQWFSFESGDSFTCRRLR